MKLNVMMEDYIFLTSKGISCNILEYSDLHQTWIILDNIEIKYVDYGDRRAEVYGRFIGRTWRSLSSLLHSAFEPSFNFGLKTLIENMIKNSQ